MSWHLKRFEKKYKDEVFESSSAPTEQFRRFYKDFVKALEQAVRKYYPDWRIVDVNDGHFYLYGHIKRHDGQMFYFSLGDVRWVIGKPWYEDVLYRTVKDLNDSHGGGNHSCPVSELLERIASCNMRQSGGMKVIA